MESYVPKYLLLLTITAALITLAAPPEVVIRKAGGPGNPEYHESYDFAGNLHGLRKCYVNNRLVCEQVFEHGTVVEATYYCGDGSKVVKKENDDYFLETTIYDKNGNVISRGQ